MSRTRETYFLHWLDPEYLNPRTGSSSDLKRRHREFLGLLKMHALLGNRLDLLDVHSIDSPAILDLFADTDFLSFLETAKDFLRLRASPDVAAAGSRLDDSELSLAKVPLHRRQQPDWVSCTFDSRNIHNRLFEILAPVKKSIEAEALFNSDSRWRDLRTSVSGDQGLRTLGLLNAMEHFFSNPNCTAEATPRRPSYFDVLSEMIDRFQKKHPVRVSLEGTRRFAKRRFRGEGQLHKRSPLVMHCEAAGLSGETRQHYMNAIQCWGIGASQSIRSKYDEHYLLRDVEPLVAYFSEPQRVTLNPMTVRWSFSGADVEPLSSFLPVSCHPSDLAWNTIARVRGRLNTGQIDPSEVFSEAAKENKAFQTAGREPISKLFKTRDSWVEIASSSKDPAKVIDYLLPLVSTSRRLPVPPPVSVLASVSTVITTLMKKGATDKRAELLRLHAARYSLMNNAER
ncbi:MAG: hypothetical protein KGN36_07265 [Acidobacteriota bacterium]|nr:hypothetical protein [Acidobacteriota bacterium]